MSRIGLKPVQLPSGVEVDVKENNMITVKGPKGSLSQKVSPEIKVAVEDGSVVFSRESDARTMRAQHGLARALVNNMVIGVTDGFQKKLVLNGVGFRAEKKGKKLVMNLGFSHPVEMEDPEGIETEVADATTVVVKGISNSLALVWLRFSPVSDNCSIISN